MICTIVQMSGQKANLNLFIFGACHWGQRGYNIFLKTLTLSYGFMDKRNDVNIQKAILDKLKIIEKYLTNLHLPTD